MPNGNGTPSNGTASYFPDKVYRWLHRGVTVILPATGGLYFGLAEIWELPNPGEVVGSISLITTFLGVTLGISTKNYRDSGDYLDGEMIVKETPERLSYKLELNKDAEDLRFKDAVIFAVTKKPEDPLDP